MEYDGKMTREVAEKEAYRCLLRICVNGSGLDKFR